MEGRIPINGINFQGSNRDKEIKVQQNQDFPVLRTWKQF